MTQKEKKLIADLLDMAADEFSNHGCNDLDEEIWEGWSSEERKNIAKEVSDDDDCNYIPDWLLMRHFSKKLRQ